MNSDIGDANMNPAESETTGTAGHLPHGSRETSATSASSMEADRSDKARSHNADMHVAEESDSSIVPEKSANQGGVAANRHIGTYAYAWDANKNKTKETITGQIPGFSFDTTLGTDPDGYDDEDRLTYFKRQSTTNPQTWNLSLVGDWNRWSNFGTAQNRTHGPAHEILTAGNAPNNAFTHDVKGNMTDIPSNILSPARKLFWDFDNQLTGVDTTGDSTPEVTYEYDVLHRRVARIEGSDSKVYIHSGNQIIADYNRGNTPGTAPVFRYVWGDYIDEPILRQSAAGTVLYFHRNQQYSTVALTNTSGEVVERYGYTAYGQLTVMNYLGNKRSWTDWSNRFLYTGREWDDTTRLFHFRARWYEPVVGRFVSRDQLGYVDGMGLYRGYFVPSQMDWSGTCGCKAHCETFCSGEALIVTWIEKSSLGAPINWTVNAIPPDALSDKALGKIANRKTKDNRPVVLKTLGTILSSKDFRNIHAFAYSIECCKGRFARLGNIDWQQHVGFTPQPYRDIPVANAWLGRYWQGVAGSSTMISRQRNDSCVTIKSRQRFQVNSLENYSQSFFEGGYLLGFAWSEIDLTVCCDGTVEVGYSGSAIPSYHAYHDGELIETYSMTNLARLKLIGLLGGGKGINDGLERPIRDCHWPFVGK